MAAILLSVTVFLYWGLLGFAVCRVASGQPLNLSEKLLMPVVGMAVLVVITGFLNRLGLPVKEFGTLLVTSSGLLASLVLIRCLAELRLAAIWPYGLVLLLATVLVGRPMLGFGFDWISVANDDMANYCLLAERLLNHGYFDLPDPRSYVQGTDYAQIYWFMHVAERARSGSELTLALLWAVTDIKAPEIFMPLIVACNLALVSAIGALSLARLKSHPRTALVAMAFAALSAMVTLGTIFQLIAQVGGLALATALSATLMHPLVERRQWLRTARDAFVPAILAGALFLWYPEVIPFFALGIALYVLVLAFFYKPALGAYLRQMVAAGAMALVGFSSLLSDVWHFLLKQTASGAGTTNRGDVIFPYMLGANGPAYFWGIIPIEQSIPEPWLSISLGFGIILSVGLLPTLLYRLFKSASAAATITLIMAAMGFYLFHAGKGFGLFKLTMFAQPFLWAAVAQWIQDKTKLSKNRLNTTLVIIVLALNIATQTTYVQRSNGEHGDLIGGSRQHLYQQIKSIFVQNSDTTLISLTPNVVMAKFQALYGQGHTVHYTAEDFFKNIQNGGTGTPHEEFSKHFDIFKKDRIGSIEFRKDAYQEGTTAEQRYIISKSDVTVFNSVLYGTIDNSYFHVGSRLSNYLQLIGTPNASHYYMVYGQGTEAYYANEPDIFFPGRFMLALGRGQFFRVLGPTRGVRMVMDISASPAKQFGSQLPQPLVQGIELPFVGRGAGRIYSQPLTLSQHGDDTYLQIDVGRPAAFFPVHKTGLERLYGAHIPNDSRTITTFARNISLIPPDYYEALTPPTSISQFPEDLGNPNLEFSGIYEDSWISEHAFFVLQTNQSSKALHIKGMIPMLGNAEYKTKIILNIDGKKVNESEIGPGKFDISTPVTSAISNGKSSHQKIEIQFSNHIILPGQDGRVVAAKIDFIGFSNE